MVFPDNFFFCIGDSLFTDLVAVRGKAAEMLLVNINLHFQHSNVHCWTKLIVVQE